jgi:hypothetical protein
MIFFSGKFLMADGSLEQDKSKRVVCLKRENSTDMQLWKIEPAIKKLKVETVVKAEKTNELASDPQVQCELNQTNVGDKLGE